MGEGMLYKLYSGEWLMFLSGCFKCLSLAFVNLSQWMFQRTEHTTTSRHNIFEMRAKSSHGIAS